ncbi:MAG: RsmD family RNA methyltransferase, partial [Leptospiraceae bacterium]|nr:RsmD family RNA methyltransferase [Leptospiraceae bacterium]
MKSQSIAISGGEFRGRKIPLPPAVSGHRHFTPSLLKEAVFQLLNNRGIPGPFWDLCTGSGQMGLEALSRGFQPVHMVELDRSRFSWLRKVCREYEVTLHNKDFLRTPSMILEGRSSNTVCFLDLPYSFWNREICPKLDAFLQGL